MTDMQERAAKVAEEHRSNVEREYSKGGKYWKSYCDASDEGRAEMRAEQRGEGIASNLIAAAIRALPADPTRAAIESEVWNKAADIIEAQDGMSGWKRRIASQFRATARKTLEAK